MLKIKLAARRQIRPLLTPDQQKRMDEEIDSLSKGGEGTLNSNSKSTPKKVEANADAFDGQESLSNAILNYSALSSAEKKSLMLQVKRAARRDHVPQLTLEQQAKVDADIRQLSRAESQN